MESTAGTCAQSIALAKAGQATWQVFLDMFGRQNLIRVSGAYSGTPVTNAAGTFETRFSAQDPAFSHALVYCRQWEAAEKTPLPFPEIALGGGVDPGMLSYRTEIVPGGGTVFVGNNGSLSDQFGMYLDGVGDLHGFSFGDHAPPSGTLFHQNQAEIIGRIAAYNSLPVINLPKQAFRETFPTAGKGAEVKSILLNIQSAVEITFSADPLGVGTTCDAFFYQTPEFLIQRASGQLTPGLSTQKARFNPGDPAQGFYTTSWITGGKTGTAYLLPLMLINPSDGQCGINIRARPLTAVLVKERREMGGFSDAFRLPVGTRSVFIPGHLSAQSSLLQAFALHATGSVWEGITLAPHVFRTPQDNAVDLLHLFQSGGSDLSISLHENNSERFINIFAGGGGSLGLGPFQAYSVPATPPTLPFPGEVTTTFAVGGGEQRLRFKLDIPSRVLVQSDGGLAAAGRLVDGNGLTLGADQGGAVDGLGFRIARTLAAGSYDLLVSTQQNGSLKVTLSEASAPVVQDENLEACLVAAGSTRIPAGEIRILDCQDAGLHSLTGIEAYANLAHLFLAGNSIADLSPLQNLPLLQNLSLEGNPVGSLAPLASLAVLFRLSLAHTQLSASHLEQLRGLTSRLNFLDLSGVSGISPSAVTALKGAMPNTILVPIDGPILE